MQIGGGKQRRGCKNSIERDSTPSAFWELGHFGNIEMPVFLMDYPQNLQVAVQVLKDEAHLWQFAGAKGLTTLCLVVHG